MDAMTAENLLIEKLLELKGDNLRFHPDLVAPALRKNSHHLDWLNEHYGIDYHEDPKAMKPEGIRSAKELMTYTDEALNWLSDQLDGKLYLKIRPFTPSSICAAALNSFTRRQRLATRHNIAADIGRLKQQLLNQAKTTQDTA